MKNTLILLRSAIMLLAIVLLWIIRYELMTIEYATFLMLFCLVSLVYTGGNDR